MQTCGVSVFVFSPSVNVTSTHKVLAMKSFPTWGLDVRRFLYANFPNQWKEGMVQTFQTNGMERMVQTFQTDGMERMVQTFQTDGMEAWSKLSKPMEWKGWSNTMATVFTEHYFSLTSSSVVVY